MHTKTLLLCIAAACGCSGNTAMNGGGIFEAQGSTVTRNNVTIAANRAAPPGCRRK